MSESPGQLAERLVAAGVITSKSMEEALAQHRMEGGYLSDLLVDRGFVEETAILGVLADGAGVVTAPQLAQAKLAPELLESIPVTSAERLCVMPLNYDGKTRTLTLAVPELTDGLLHDVREATGAAKLKFLLALHHPINACVQRWYYQDPYAFVWLERRPATTQRIAQAAEAFMARLTPTPMRPRPRTLPPILLSDLGAPAEPPAPPPSPAPEVVHKLHQELETARREIHMLQVANELSLYLARERNVFELLQRVLAFSFDNVPADEGVLLLRDGASGELRPCAYRTRGDPAQEANASQTLVQQIERTGQAVLAADAAYDPVFWQSKTVATNRARSLMGVPLMIGEKIEGVIALTAFGTAGAFTAKDVNVLTGIAAQTGVALENLTLSRRVAADAQTRDRLSRFLSPALVEAATRGELALVESGVLQEATILFADIRGFTALAEHLPPTAVVQLLNHHFELLLDVVFAREGILDKFIGDGLMALWGVPVARPDDARRAMQAAVEMRDRVQQLKGVVPGRVPYEVGIGIHTGPVVFGAIGAARRLELTAVGDAVNVASRLCGAAQPGEIIASEAARRAAGNDFSYLPMPPLQLKGRAQPLHVFRVQSAIPPTP